MEEVLNERNLMLFGLVDQLENSEIPEIIGVVSCVYGQLGVQTARSS